MKGWKDNSVNLHLDACEMLPGRTFHITHVSPSYTNGLNSWASKMMELHVV